MMSEPARRCFERFNENLALAVEMQERLDDDRGWCCIVRFYATLHLINAYLIDKPSVRFTPSSSDHTKRRAALDRCPELREAPDRYRRLKDLSESIRYDAGFAYTESLRDFSIAWLDKIVAIVEPKLKKA
jgi:hypothetical protein